MIKFFRKIRQQLIVENRFNKYLLYAIGEIVLVVIGILIALQINNWNVDRINNKKEIQILKSFKTDLQSNRIELQRVIQKSNTTKNTSDAILNYQNTNVKALSLLQLDTLIMNAIGFTVYKSYEGTVQDILGSGTLDIIKNDSIRLAIASWQANLKDIREWEKLEKVSNKEYLDYLQQRIPIYKMRYKSGILTEQKKIELFADDTFLNQVNARSRLPGTLNALYKKELTKIDKLINMVERELNKKN